MRGFGGEFCRALASPAIALEAPFPGMATELGEHRAAAAPPLYGRPLAPSAVRTAHVGTALPFKARPYRYRMDAPWLEARPGNHCMDGAPRLAYSRQRGGPARSGHGRTRRRLDMVRKRDAWTRERDRHRKRRKSDAAGEAQLLAAVAAAAECGGGRCSRPIGERGAPCRDGSRREQQRSTR
jgi:hypothetical protein